MAWNASFAWDSACSSLKTLAKTALLKVSNLSIIPVTVFASNLDVSEISMAIGLLCPNSFFIFVTNSFLSISVKDCPSTASVSRFMISFNASTTFYVEN